MQHGGEGDTYQEKAGVLDDFQSVIHFVWCPDHDATGTGRRAEPYDFPWRDEDLLVLLCRCHDYAGTCKLCV